MPKRCAWHPEHAIGFHRHPHIAALTSREPPHALGFAQGRVTRGIELKWFAGIPSLQQVDDVVERAQQIPLHLGVAEIPAAVLRNQLKDALP